LILSRYGEKIDAQVSKNQIALLMGVSFFKTLHAFLYSSMCSLNPRKYFRFLQSLCTDGKVVSSSTKHISAKQNPPSVLCLV
jgi:hypothetical protein